MAAEVKTRDNIGSNVYSEFLGVATYESVIRPSKYKKAYSGDHRNEKSRQYSWKYKFGWFSSVSGRITFFFFKQISPNIYKKYYR